jgi:hypothetical protein
VAELDRNAPSLWNAVHERWQGWDGAADSLWSQAIRPLLDPREMASSPEHLQAQMLRQPALAAAWRRVFGRELRREEPQAVLVGTAKLVSAYVATLVSPRTPFDEFRDALARGDQVAAARVGLLDLGRVVLARRLDMRPLLLQRRLDHRLVALDRPLHGSLGVDGPCRLPFLIRLCWQQGQPGVTGNWPRRAERRRPDWPLTSLLLPYWDQPV